ncbi:MAG: radical SAM domain-containing protein [Candidatus Magnetoglobus multicellularis str. Araruama]|uniref:Radical SAM domain-containing protein n=1 Tax=Candidatus Magnetoglobus multicellularis str. Araruama TaxID=890399 RepID=A0A1V1NWG8_9BACT|nr:MAG: radical SAM domain-containing protein [Candidatus Magnetoglobus multicellularis str. Araruama]
MKWSDYNVIFESSKHGTIAYNGLTGTFVELDARACKEVDRIRVEADNYDPTDHLLLYEQLRKARMLVQEGEEEELINLLALQRRQREYDNTILGLTIVPTLNCNFGCTYCYERKYRRPVRMGDATEEKLVEFIQEFNKIHELTISWYGGEPLLEFDRIVSLSKKFEKLSFPFKAGLVTNGYLLDSHVAEKLSELRIESIQVSIDGPAEVHDKRRMLVGGGKTYFRILENLKKLMAVWNGKLFIRVNTDMRNEEQFALIHDELSQEFKGTEAKIYAGIVQDCLASGLALDCQFKADQEGNFFIEQYKTHGIVDRMFFSKKDFKGV